jgi:limonene-1,2-epoxide hydrolase
MVMNTTYAITAKVTDKHGNGVSGASVKFSGFGAAQFNGAADATRTTDRTGSVTAFLRSLKDVDGPSAIGVELLGTNLTFTANEGLAAVYTDDTKTAHDESKWSSTIEAQVTFLKTAAEAGVPADAVAIGSFNGRVAVRVEGLQGQRLSVKVGKKWYVVASVPTNKYVWSVPSRKGTVVAVSAYINGDLENTSTITVK